MRRAGTILAMVVVAIIAAIGIFLTTIDINRYRGTIQDDLTTHLGRNVTLGEMHLSVIPFRFVAHDVSIVDNPAFRTEKPFIQAQELGVSVKLLPLLHKDVEIRSLYLHKHSVDLIKNAHGVWNYSSLGTSSSCGSGPGQGQLSLSKLVIEGGEVAITDEQGRTGTSVYNHIDATLSDFAPDRPFSIRAAAYLAGPGTQEVRLDGSGTSIRQDQPAATPFHGTLDLQQIALSTARQFVSSPAPAKLNGTSSGHANISSDNGKLAANGGMNFENVRIDNRDLGYPADLQYSIHNDIQADLLTIDSATVKLGSTPLQLNGTVNSKPTPAEIDLRARTGAVSIAELAKLAAASGTALAPGANVSGMVDADIQARGAAGIPALNGTVHGRNLQITGMDFPQSVQSQLGGLGSDTHCDSIVPVHGDFKRNFHERPVALEQYASKTPTIDATLRAPNAELPAVLSMAKAYSVTAWNNLSGAGTLRLE